MTRFLMSLSMQSNLLILLLRMESKRYISSKSTWPSIETLAQALINIFNSSSKIKVIGIRHGEKMHETLLTEEEMFKADDLGDYYRIKSDSRA